MIYASTPARRSAQIIGDALTLAWCVVWILLGKLVYEAISLLQKPADEFSSAASGLGDSIGDAGGSLPSFLKKPFEGVANSADSLSSAATSQSDTINHVAWVVSFVVALPPIFMLLALVIPLRLRWIRETASLKDLRNSPNFVELMARRAVVRQPLRRLRKVSVDPIGDIENGNFSALAALEARQLGIELPSSPPMRPGLRP